MIRLLIIDDHAVVRRGLKEILADEHDLQVYETPDPQGALKLIREHKLDLVVLDIDLPGKSGLDLLGDIKREHSNLPVLILSIYPEDQFALRALKAGASGFLSKDAAPEQLVSAVRKILKGGRYFSEVVAEQLLTRNKERLNASHPHETLSQREFQILCLFGTGKSVKEIAKVLSLSPPTVSTYRTRILEKMELKSTADLVRYAVQNRLAN